MFRNVYLIFSWPFILGCLSTVSTGYWISDWRTAKQLNVTNDAVSEGNETSLFQDSFENSTTDSEGSDALFWTVSDDVANGTTEDNVMLQMDNADNQEKVETNDEVEAQEIKENDKAENQDAVLSDSNPVETTELHEKIVLQRMNCRLEIAIQNTYDVKMQIKFGRLENNTSGECCITLSGPENSLLAVLISNIHLYQNGSDKEVLKVITNNHGSSYVLKEYRHRSSYQPLLLTETHTVYLVLNYKVTTVSQDAKESYFDLEVLTYHKNENYGQKKITGYYPAFSPIEDQKLFKFYT